MGHVEIQVKLVGYKDSAIVPATVDTGALNTTIPEKLAERIGVNITGQGWRVQADGQRVQVWEGEIPEIVLTGRSSRLTTTHLIPVDILGDEVLIGVTTLEMMGLAVDPNRNEIFVRRDTLRV